MASLSRTLPHTPASRGLSVGVSSFLGGGSFDFRDLSGFRSQPWHCQLSETEQAPTFCTPAPCSSLGGLAHSEPHQRPEASSPVGRTPFPAPFSSPGLGAERLTYLEKILCHPSRVGLLWKSSSFLEDPRQAVLLAASGRVHTPGQAWSWL